MHAEVPVTATYLPAAQAMQSAALSLPVWSMYLPSMHSEQPVSPGASVYLPAAHAEHAVAASESASTDPITQSVQAIGDALAPDSTYCPGAHS